MCSLKQSGTHFENSIFSRSTCSCCPTRRTCARLPLNLQPPLHRVKWILLFSVGNIAVALVAPLTIHFCVSVGFLFCFVFVGRALLCQEWNAPSDAGGAEPSVQCLPRPASWDLIRSGVFFVCVFFFYFFFFTPFRFTAVSACKMLDWKCKSATCPTVWDGLWEAHHTVKASGERAGWGGKIHSSRDTRCLCDNIILRLHLNVVNVPQRNVHL